MGLLNEWGRRALTVGLVVGMLASAMGCSMLGLSEDEEDNTLLYGAAAYLLTRSSTVSTYCSTGSVVSNGNGLGVESTSLSTCWANGGAGTIAGGVPTWISNNFKGFDITDGGTSWDFATATQNRGLPPHKSIYYNGVTACQESQPTGNYKNPNSIQNNDFTMKIPKTPNTTQTAAPASAAGVTVNGVIIFNDTAAPGDSLATELYTMDKGYGHPQENGKYHYHTEPCKITRNDSSLLGVAADGYAIYGRYDSDGTQPTLDSRNFHAGSTGIDGNSAGHYHVESSYLNLLIRTNLVGSTL